MPWSEDRLRFAVSDAGEGMSPEPIQRVFHPYEQAERTTSHTQGGTGLGLALSRSLAGITGGTLSAESSLGVGTTFRLEIPTKEAEA